MEQAVLNIPKYIYHATPYENLTKILNTGIEARSMLASEELRYWSPKVCKAKKDKG